MLKPDTPSSQAPPQQVQKSEDALAHIFPREMAVIKEQVRRGGPPETTLLFTGETGTGKPRLGRFIHELSSRPHEPFLVVDCGALSPSLVHSELFGHVKGA